MEQRASLKHHPEIEDVTSTIDPNNAYKRSRRLMGTLVVSPFVVAEYKNLPYGSLLKGGGILVGHAIKNDLKALLLGHPIRYIRDPSMYCGGVDVTMTRSMSRPS